MCMYIKKAIYKNIHNILITKGKRQHKQSTNINNQVFVWFLAQDTLWDLSSLARGWTWAPGSESTKFYPLSTNIKVDKLCISSVEC